MRLEVLIKGVLIKKIRVYTKKYGFSLFAINTEGKISVAA